MYKLNLQLFAEENIEGGAPISESPEGEYTQGEENVETPDNSVGEDASTEEDLPQTDKTPEGDGAEEEEFIPKSQVSKIVSDRVNKLNDKYKEFDRYKGTMDKLIAMSGLTESQFYAQLEQVELQEKAKSMGVSPEIAQQMLASQHALEEAKRTTMDMKYQMEEQSLLTNPLYEGYNNSKEQVRQMAETTGMSLEQSYWATNGPALLEKQTKLAAQRVNHNNTHKQKRSTVETEGNTKTPNTPGASLDDSQRQMAESLGLTADEYALYSNDDLDYDKIVAMKTKK